MIKINLIAILLLISISLKGQQNTEELFFYLFPKKETPLLTKGIGSDFYFERNGYKLLPDSISLRYICFGDTDRMYFSYIQHHMEDPTYEKKITQKYEYYAYALIEYENFNLILFPLRNPYRKELHARSYTRDGQFIDSLIVNKYCSELYFDKMSFKYSLIRTNDIVVFNYINLYKPYMRDAENKEELDKTKIIISNYSIEEDGHFKLEKQDSVLLKTKISKFEGTNGNIEDDDPLKQYMKEYKP